MAIKTTGYWDDIKYDDFDYESFNKKWYGKNAKDLGEDFVFDPKNPPRGCTAYHPPLPLKVDGLATEIYGSSCINPNIDDADIYVSFDTMAKHFDWEQPWEESNRVHIRYMIRDGSVPDNQKQFDACLDYVIEALADGKKIHAGCIGGHGRTGLFLAAVAQKTMGSILAQEGISAIDYVRDTYCNNAVETFKQVLYLYGVYDIDPPMAQEKRIMEFATKFEEEMGVDFRTVMKNTEYSKMQPTISEVERLISASYISSYVAPASSTLRYPDDFKPRRELTLAQQELEDLFYEQELKTINSLQLQLEDPDLVNLDEISPSILEEQGLEKWAAAYATPKEPIDTGVYIKDMGFDFTYPDDSCEPFTIDTPIVETKKPGFKK